MPQSWRPHPDTPFYKVVVPTIDTARNAFVTNALIKAQKAVLLVGNSGTGEGGETRTASKALPTVFASFRQSCVFSIIKKK